MLGFGLARHLTILSFVDAALVRKLVAVSQSVAARDRVRDPFFLRGSQRRGYVSYLKLLDWRARTGAFASITTSATFRAGFTLSTARGARMCVRTPGSEQLLSDAGGRPPTRILVAGSEEGPPAAPTVMLALTFWQDALRRQPGRLGTRSGVPGRNTRVIGVLPSDFHFAMAEQADFWAAIQEPASLLGGAEPAAAWKRSRGSRMACPCRWPVPISTPSSIHWRSIGIPLLRRGS